MKSYLHTIPALAAALVLGAILVPTRAITQGALAPVSLPLSAEEKEILSHMSLVYLDDGQGGTVKTIRISEINLQIVNGLEATNGYPANPDSTNTGQTDVNGLGNLIVGYNELGNPNGDDRTGSHHVVVGHGNSYSSFGGFVGPLDNTTEAPFASVTGGMVNTASGLASSVSGGLRNVTDWYGYAASVSGGVENFAGSRASSVSGGRSNAATSSAYYGGGGYAASVIGGMGNSAHGNDSSISGGVGNVTVGEASSISGGLQNRAFGLRSSVGGGASNSASGASSSVSGGKNRSVTDDDDWRAGTLLEND